VATRADVARLAGVSPSTVTYVLTGQRPISAGVRERVLAAMAELRYRPNAMAAGLAGGRSNTIALLLPTTERDLKESDLEYVVGASKTAREFGYRLVLSTADRSDSDELLHLTRSGLVDGVLVMEVFLDDERVPLLRSCEVPFALIGRTRDLEGTDYADRDFAEAGRLAVGYLHGLGHQHVAFVDAPPRPSGPGYGVSVRAVEGVRSACAAAGVELTVLACELSVEAGRALLIELVRAHPEITAIIAFNDEAVMGVYLAAREIGLRIPEDLSVMSTSLSEQRAAFFLPPITTISPPATQIAQSATTALIRKLRPGPSELTADSQGLFTGELVERASTGPPPAR
jgi:DNA-binding LacI/PurR family transcriptional regulator